MKQKKSRLFVIPALLEISPNEYGRFEDYPDAQVFGDTALAEVLQTTRLTVIRWRKENLIPYKQMRNYVEFNLLDVVNALRAAGYSQDTPGNPTGHNG